ncbi:unnamed protein product [Candida verbasci]|uniref:C3H1-type domain-containing protein n=1 Tax=Candida verbasci TaxID=1227364 RepID=A0A9W4XB51_9ASCO|nr:unnamed protein product [Candida verbasci]
MMANQTQYQQPFFNNKLSTCSTLSSNSSSTTDFNDLKEDFDCDLLPDLWQTSSNESSISCNTNYANLSKPFNTSTTSSTTTTNTTRSLFEPQFNLFSSPSPPQQINQIQHQPVNSIWNLHVDSMLSSDDDLFNFDQVIPQQKQPVNTQLYKTELCASFMKIGICPYDSKCQFAHGELELKKVERSPKWRSKPCQNWTKYGTCRYGNRCCFKHGE